ncbi:MAG: amidohydrolase family protein [Tenuifilaceae bacterium]|nr:amidohydrolase family protein [Tenuifilaceae bacterium]
MSCTSNNVDLIITNATIYSVDADFTIYQSMAVANGKVVALGDSETIQSKYKADNIIDLEGKPVYPGLIDPHCHFLGYGLGLRNAWLAGVGSWAEAVDRLVKHQNNYPSDWVLGRGWNQNEWDVKEFPTKELLDKAFPDKPVLLTRIDGHAAIANSKAMELAGFNADTLVTGGEIVRVNGEPTGVLVDNAINLVRDLVPADSKDDKVLALDNAQKNCFAVGLTSVSDAGTDLADALLFDELHKAGKLKMKINVMLNPTQENYEHFLDKGVYVTPNLSVRTVKLFADGALGSRGALMIEPYSDAPGTIGLQLETTEKLTAVSRKAHESGYQVAVHCIGDAAARLMIDIFEEFLEPDNDLRWRIEHAQTIHPDDLPRFGRLAIVPSVQTTHATSDMIWAVDRLGDRIKYAYTYQDLLKQNGWLPNGSDFPIEHINPIYGFYAGVARQNTDGFPPDGFQMENALTREQALRAMTIWAAKAAFEEDVKGSLEPGKAADFVVLDDDIMTAPNSKLPSVKVEKTFVNGELVYSIK